MIAPAFPITEPEVSDLIDLHCTRRDEADNATVKTYHANRADFWSDYYLDHFCRIGSDSGTSPVLPATSSPVTELEVHSVVELPAIPPLKRPQKGKPTFPSTPRTVHPSIQK